MKRILSIVICIVLLLSITACAPAEPIELKAGAYYLDGNFKKGATPYIWFYPDQNEFYISSGTTYSYAERGTYEIKDDQLIATSQYTVFTFDINNSDTLVLVDSGNNDYFRFQLGIEFIYSTEIK